MKGTRIFAAVLATSIIMTTAVAGASAAGADHSAYGYLAGKEDRIDDGRSYAGKDYAGGEQGDTSAYGFRAGRMDKPWNTVE